MTDVGDGYRLINKETDDFAKYQAITEVFMEISGWEPTNETIAWAHKPSYRIPANTPDPGEGWRIVNTKTEQPELGDEYLSGKDWCDRAYDGAFCARDHYRRRITPAPEVASNPVNKVLLTSDVFHRPRKPNSTNGILSQKHWIENRVEDIYEAMEQYRRDKYIIPVEWVEELAEHLRELRGSNDT